MMEDKEKELEPQKTEPQVGSGNLLASARKKQNRSVEEIAEELNLSVTQIKTIELDQTEGLPEPTYVRGYIRSYAKLLGLNAEEILESYLHPNWQKGSNLDDLPKGIAAAEEESKSTFAASKMIVAIVFLLSIAFLWYTGLLGDIFGLERNDKASQTQVVEELEALTPTVNADSAVEANQGTDIDSESDQNPEQLDDAVPVSNEDADALAQEVDINDDLTLTFDQTCWVDIRDSKDNRIAYKSYAAGDTLTVTNKGKLHVFLGNAEGVNAIYKGQPFDLSSYREGVYAKFSLSKD